MKLLLACLALLLPLGAAAQESFPQKPVRLIVPFPPGGGTDLLGRILAAKLGELWGQQVIVDNRAGAQGNVGTAAGAKAAPDGYTLTFAHQGALVINPHLYKDPGYDTLKDFAPVARATEMAFIAVAHPSVPAADLRELAQYAKRNPGKLTFASTSAGPHIVGELFKQATGTELLHVPYKGAGPAINDLLGGQVSVMFSNPTSTVPHVRSGKLRALGVMDSKRNPALPEVPTAQELGIAELSSVIEWYGIVVPAATSPALVRKLSADLLRVMSQTDVRERILKAGQTPSPAGAEEFGAMIRADFERWRKVVAAAGIRPE
ncbi:MAG: LacI family transcriptional regulator [Burkholderiales bacterium]|jgi:tripartite-type tricarboxylate transporter receptor subunit TctC|nr:LacI family transcriptional regulator [Burkholderiales bacterium]